MALLHVESKASEYGLDPYPLNCVLSKYGPQMLQFGMVLQYFSLLHL